MLSSAFVAAAWLTTFVAAGRAETSATVFLRRRDGAVRARGDAADAHRPRAGERTLHQSACVGRYNGAYRLAWTVGLHRRVGPGRVRPRRRSRPRLVRRIRRCVSLPPGQTPGAAPAT